MSDEITSLRAQCRHFRGSRRKIASIDPRIRLGDFTRESFVCSLRKSSRISQIIMSEELKRQQVRIDNFPMSSLMPFLSSLRPSDKCKRALRVNDQACRRCFIFSRYCKELRNANRSPIIGSIKDWSKRDNERFFLWISSAFFQESSECGKNRPSKNLLAAKPAWNDFTGARSVNHD